MSYQIHPWKVVETSLNKEHMRLSESLTSTGNGYMGMRGNFEEDYSGDTHLGTYIGGVWFPDKTRVGWWKNGYPQYFGKAINCVRMNGIHVEINDQPLDLATISRWIWPRLMWWISTGNWICRPASSFAALRCGRLTAR